MSRLFTYEGGPKDQQSEHLEEDHFPEKHTDGEYRWTGNARATGSLDPVGPAPESDGAVAAWFPKAE